MTSQPARPRVLVVGCGGIGGVLACVLRSAQCDLSIATTNAAVRRAWTTSGPRLNDRVLAPLARRRVLETARDSAHHFDFVFVAVQPQQVGEVAESLIGRLSPRARVVCLPNGLCEDRLAAVLGEECIIGAVVAWGARMVGPGAYVRTSSGGFKVGTLSGRSEPMRRELDALLSHVGPVKWTHNLKGARFSKLALNCAVSTLGTIGGSTLGDLLVRADARQLALDILREAVLVARAEGVVLEPVTSLDLEWLIADRSPRATLVRSLAQHAMLLAVGARYRNLRSSMLAAIERGRSPSIDYLNGEIVARGQALGIATPFNEAASRMVWDIANGRRAAGTHALKRVREMSELSQEGSLGSDAWREGASI